MKIKTKYLLSSILFLASLLVFQSCQDNSSTEPEIVAGSRGNFFPLLENKQWDYENRFYSTDDDSSLVNTENVSITIDGDTAIEGKTYKKFINDNGGLVKVVRQEGSEFFGRNHELYGFSHEYKFLDVAAPDGGTWSYLKDEGTTKTEYVVKALSAEKKIGNNTFKKVLQIQVNYYDKTAEGDFTLRYSTWHFYADGMGEVYAFYPYPASNAFADLNVVLVGYTE